MEKSAIHTFSGVSVALEVNGQIPNAATGWRGILSIDTVKVSRFEVFIVGIGGFENGGNVVIGLLKSVVCQY